MFAVTAFCSSRTLKIVQRHQSRNIIYMKAPRRILLHAQGQNQRQTRTKSNPESRPRNVEVHVVASLDGWPLQACGVVYK